MDLEQRVEELEREVRALKSDIQGTLIDIREALPDKPAPASNWQTRAWVLALLNVLVAVSLFTNIYLYVPGLLPVATNEVLAAWLRAFWIAIAFVWLLLQLYPLALLLEQEDRQQRSVAWRSATAYLRARPGVLAVATFAVLVAAIVNTVLPEAWLVIALLLAGVGVAGVWQVLSGLRRDPHPRGPH